MILPTSLHGERWMQAGRKALLSGSLASVISTSALGLLGRHDVGSSIAPTNATSHWLWGDTAYDTSEATLRHTGVGYATHHLSALFWATLYERWLDENGHMTAASIARDAALMAAVAAFVDYGLTPKRLRPGFERHLSLVSLVGVFASFAAGLALGAYINRQHDRRLERLRQLP